MTRITVWAGTVLLAAVSFGPVAAPSPQEHVRMLIDQIPATIWSGQRPVRPNDHPTEQRSLRADVTAFLKGRFRVTGDRLFVIPPDDGVVLSGGMFVLSGPSQFQEIQSEPAFDQRPFIRPVPLTADSAPNGSTLLTIGMTQSEPRIYTVIALHTVPDSTDELIGYFQLEPLIPDPIKGL